MQVLQQYESQSKQKVNKEKSFFYTHQNTSRAITEKVGDITGMAKGVFPFKYLGCPVSHSRTRKEHFVELIDRVRSKIRGWKGRMLSFGGKEVLINSVLQGIPIYTLSAIIPPQCVFKEIHRLLARFFWNPKDAERRKHWASWNKVCMPKHGGGLGFRSLVCGGNLIRTQTSLWSNFLWNKYCKKQIPTLVQWRGGSQQWKGILIQREKVEQNLWWEPKGGTSTIWYDNWTNLGPLFKNPSEVVSCHPLRDISNFLTEDGWNLEVMQEMLPQYVMDHVEKEMMCMYHGRILGTSLGGQKPVMGNFQ